MTAYYNEIEPYAAQWLRNLISAGHIAPGDVDERDIRDVRPHDLRGYTQCHFFAGIGVWSHALRRAGWPDGRRVWTGSCPCQPFSAAGRGAGFADERHLWPAFFHLIEQCAPPVVFGEQVASKDGLTWLDLVQADLEDAGYACGPIDLCAAGVGAPHIRQRLYWVAHSSSTGLEGRDARPMGRERAPAERGGEASGLGHAERVGARRDTGAGAEAERGPALWPERDDAGPSGAVGGLADDTFGGWREERADAGRSVVGDRAQGFAAGSRASGGDLRPGPTNGLWRDADWLLCRDGKWRPVEPGTFPLAHGAPARVGRLRAYGNAINAEQAEAFIGAYLDAECVRLGGVFS